MPDSRAGDAAWVTVVRLGRARGLRGEIFGDVWNPPGSYSWLRRVWIRNREGEILFQGEPLEVLEARPFRGRLVLRLMDPTAGSVRFKGEEIAGLDKQALRRLRRHMQIIFQDPYASLNPRMTLLDIVGEPLLVVDGVKSQKARQERVEELLKLVGLRPEYLQRYPHAFSGGQRQRIVIARALALNPRFVVADEPVSALDVSVQAQVLNLLLKLQQELHLTYLFVAHDLSVVKHICDRVAVMYVGKIVETAPTRELFFFPKHPYTAALMSAVPVALSPLNTYN